ncbi:ABC transporter permease, partial [Shewanella sp. SR41-2]|nr:ABC transporter permease [Shewanella sp. SR41-2]
MNALFNSVSNLGAATRKNIDSIGLATLFLLRIISSLFTGLVSFK